MYLPDSTTTRNKLSVAMVDIIFFIFLPTIASVELAYTFNASARQSFIYLCCNSSYHITSDEEYWLKH